MSADSLICMVGDAGFEPATLLVERFERPEKFSGLY